MISLRRVFEICVFTAALLLAAMAFHAWLASHDEQLRLQSTLAAQKQTIDAADARERDRAGALDKTLAQIQQSKREVLTPEEILRELPKYLPLPQPITMISPPQVARASPTESDSQTNGKGTDSSETANAADTRPSPGSAPASLGGVEPSAANPNESQNQRTARSNMPITSTLPDAANQSRGTGRQRSRAETTAPASASRGSIERSGGYANDSQQQRTARSNMPIASSLPDAENQSRGAGAETTAPPAVVPPGDPRVQGPVDPPPAARNASELKSAAAQIPAADLKPLYDYIQDCRSCQAQLASAKQNRADDATKLQAITRERDAAIAAAKGGSFWRHLRSNAKWFALGAAAGAIATASAAASHHAPRTTHTSVLDFLE